jgi:dienelactone hydrolase
MADDRPTWHARIRAAHETAIAQKEFRADALATVGYCFGGSSALEHLRTGGDVRGIVSIHGGLDLVGPEWAPTVAPARALLCTGADDPMATPTQWQAVKAGLASAGVDWELDLYSGTRHGFTNPASDLMPEDGFAYHPRSAARAWSSATQFLRDLFADEKHDQ